MTEVKTGYKQTDIGVIPEDWDVIPVSSLIKEPPKYGINAPAVNLHGSLPVYIRITDISEDGQFLPDEKVGVNSPLSHLYKLELGDIVLARTGASVGKSYEYHEEDGALIYAGFLIKIKPNQSKLKTGYLAQYLKSDPYWSWVKINSMRSGQPGINGNEYGQLKVPIPQPEEQKAIAVALSDVDGLIESLEQLIAKKRDMKTATMQQLLTGKKRLPGFEISNGYRETDIGLILNDWDTPLMGELAQIQRGASPRPINSPVWFDHKSSVGWLRISDVSKSRKYLKETIQYLSEEGIANSRYVAKGNLVMSICATVGRPIITCKDLCIHDGFVVFVHLKADKEYMYYSLSKIESDWSKYGQTGSQMNLNTTLINNTKIPLPQPEEQKAIATVLSDMDTEIDALEQRLEKARHLKTGMMQELLTGKTRLIKTDSKQDIA